ncbi:hypothetical protein GI374_09425 [Paracoccus sp. S-4012]|uniref:hypothetical protein n=1 Tax=Paracoccus sp. S-4012 TaxID=2665648 RepID=UPI0012B0D9C4|nr:hypothetical protein [Paracoccus sp. S-4012]MRX50661.1 hypothetical protein [Paracoccus sp. S-4012]
MQKMTCSQLSTMTSPATEPATASAARRPDPRRYADCRSAAAQHRGGEGADQRGPERRRDLAREACQGTAEGSRWPLHRQVFHATARADGTKPVDLAIPGYGYKSHISIDRRHEIVRRQVATAPVCEGLIRRAKASRDVWADSAYRSAEKEVWLTDHRMMSRIHRKKRRGRAMATRTSRATAARSALRSKVEHVLDRRRACG